MDDNLEIRPFLSDDTESAVMIYNELYPDMATTLEEKRHVDSNKFENADLHRWMVEIDGEIIGLFEYEHDLWDYHPKRLEINIEVLPALQGKGIGTSLYEHLMGKITHKDPDTLTSWIRDNHPRNSIFLKDRGFRETYRQAFSTLDLAKWSYDEDLDMSRQLESAGIEIVDLDEFRSVPDWERKLYDLDKSVSVDIPCVTSVPEFDFWKKDVLGSKTIVPKGYLIAVKDGMAIGTSNIFRMKNEEAMDIGLTAVRREFRRMGIATTLKIRAMAYAKKIGVKILTTCNDENNGSILSINRRLGFVRGSDFVNFRKDIRPSG